MSLAREAAVAWSAAVSTAAASGRFAPRGSGLSAPAAQSLADFVAGGGGRLLAITGAGCSTESGVPDYRSPQGSYSRGHKPMLHSEFVGKASNRARYWARSLGGWRYFAEARPNAAHRALAALEGAGQVSALVTQNVDGLHSRAGSRRVVDLHGRNDTVVCRSCSAARPRLDYQLELEQVNAEWMAQYMPPLQDVGEIRADGDAHLAREDFQGFKVVPCHSCDDGVVMPDVVFFGGSLRKETRDLAKQFVEGASGVLVLGTSVKVFSAFQLVQAAHKAGKPVAIVNIGETRADNLVPESLRFPVRCSEALMAVCDRLGIAVE